MGIIMIQKIRMDMSIGSNIQKMRYQNKLTQEQVIARLNQMCIRDSSIAGRHSLINAISTSTRFCVAKRI